jgi:hypothetical protein
MRGTPVIASVGARARWAVPVLLLVSCLDYVGEPPTRPDEYEYTFTDVFTGVAIKPDGLVIAPGDSLQMIASTIPHAPMTWTWQALPTTHAIIDSTGLFRALFPGEITVYACAARPQRLCGSAPVTIR